MRRTPFVRDSAGFTGAERALIVCVALAIVVLTGRLVSRGSEKSSSDARRALTDNPLVAAGRGPEGPLRYTAALQRPGEIATARPPEALTLALGDRFEIVPPDLDGERRPNQVTKEEFDQVSRLYDDIQKGRTDIRVSPRDSVADPSFRKGVMNDFASLLQTAAGRDLLSKMAHNPYGNTITVTMHRDASGRPDTTNAFADAADPRQRGRWADGRGVPAIIAYVPGKGVVIPGGNSPWLPLRVDVVLYHELVHAYHMTHGTMNDNPIRPGPGVADIDVRAGIRSSEYQAVGLGGYRDAPLTENRYRAERNKIDGHKGEISGDGTMKQRDTYVLQTAAAFSPAPAPVPAPEPSP